MHRPPFGPGTLDVSYLRPLLMLMMTLGVATATPAQNLRLLGEDPADDGHVDASFIAQHDTWQPGTTVTVGLRLAMDEGWHTYWKNPGDAGMPTSLTWDLPEGWAAHGIDWPAPVYFETNGIGGYGYVGTVVLPVRIDVPAEAAQGEVTLKAKADWLECADICVAGSADLQLTGRVGNDEPQPVAEHVELFATAAARQPEVLEAGASAYFNDHFGVYLMLRDVPEYTSAPADLWSVRFFPESNDTIDMSAPQRLVGKRFEANDSLPSQIEYRGWPESFDIGMRPSAARDAPPERLIGLIVYESLDPKQVPYPPRVWRIDVPVEILPSSEP